MKQLGNERLGVATAASVAAASSSTAAPTQHFQIDQEDKNWGYTDEEVAYANRAYRSLMKEMVAQDQLVQLRFATQTAGHHPQKQDHQEPQPQQQSLESAATAVSTNTPTPIPSPMPAVFRKQV